MAIKAKNLEDLSAWTNAYPQLINGADRLGNTALHWAATRGQSAMVSLLIARGAAINVTNTGGATPLHCAALAGSILAVETLLRQGADPHAKNCSGHDIFSIASSRHQRSLLQLLDRYNNGEFQPPPPPPPVQLEDSPLRQPSRASPMPTTTMMTDAGGMTDSSQRSSSAATTAAVPNSPSAQDAIQAVNATMSTIHPDQPLSARSLLAVQQQMLRLLASLAPAPQTSTAVQTAPVITHAESDAGDVVSVLRRAMVEAVEEKARAEIRIEAVECLADVRVAFAHAHTVLVALPTAPLGARTSGRFATTLLSVAAPAAEQVPASQAAVTFAADIGVQVPRTPSDPRLLQPGRVHRMYLPRDAVVVVHGEKHLPDQPQMLLVQLRGEPQEVWVPIDSVAHCDSVVAYLAAQERYQPTTSPTPTGAPGGNGNRVGSPLGETEREELAQQLAALRRLRTAHGSRESLTSAGGNQPHARDARRGGGASAGSPPLAGSSLMMLPDAYQDIPEAQIELLHDVLPPAPADGEAIDPDLQPSPMEDTSPEELLARQYELRLAALEMQHAAVRRERLEQEERVRALKARRQLDTTLQRAQVHAEYDARMPELREKQPWVEHPLQQTNDRQAALLLDKLHEEISNAERERRIFDEYGRKGVTAATESPPHSGRRYKTLRERRQEGADAQPVGEVALVEAQPPAPPREPSPQLPPQYLQYNPYYHQRKGAASASNSSTAATTTSGSKRANREQYEQYMAKQLMLQPAPVVDEEPHIAAQPSVVGVERRHDDEEEIVDEVL